jgi:hypothetical protein
MSSVIRFGLSSLLLLLASIHDAGALCDQSSSSQADILGSNPPNGTPAA